MDTDSIASLNRGQMTTPTLGTYTYRGSGLLTANCMSASMLSLVNRGQRTTPTPGTSTYRGSGLLAAKCMSAVYDLFLIVVRGPLLRLELPHTVGAVF